MKPKEYDLRSAQAKERQRPTLASASSRAGGQASADAEALARGHSQGDNRGSSRGRSQSGGKAAEPSSQPGVTTDAVTASVAGEPHAGVLLRKARQERGLSVADIAKQTRIADRWILAIEEVQLEQLPAPVFAIGYVRNYARAVGLDPNEIVERFRQFGQKRDDSFWGTLHDRSGPTPRSLEQAATNRRYMLWTVAFLLLGLAAFGAAWLRNRH